MNNDNIQRFLFENRNVRGEIVRLSQCVDTMARNHDYPEALQALLGQSLAAASLMSTILKFKGKVSLQFQGKGPLNLLYAQANDQQQVKATAKYDQDLRSDDFHQLLSGGHLVVTIEPDEGKRYQGIIPLERDSLAECLEHYFELSEQLATRLFLFNDGGAVYGLLLQQLPNEKDDEDFWQHVSILSDTLKAADFKAWTNQALLQHLFHEDDVRLFDDKSVEYRCGCSLERCERSLLTLSLDDLQSLLDEQEGELDMTCEFCNTTYHIDGIELSRLIKTQIPAGDNSGTEH